ncbi:hypothetical protein PIB30_012209 [Stylosanthes scabra]|uniref:F-box domain-containing protein n=1 Tax=Stylosanthes scabra TaxID=79078 RepID=A0ABU6U5Z4_9FABA|nr:hypothetical protein [Stylosanthes scabra]
MDRISALPKGILHDILERLPDKDAAKTCVLSKSWRQTWFSFPVLSVRRENIISFHDFPRNPEDPIWLGKVDMFTEYVTKRLMRLRDQHLTIKEVKLDLTNITICTQVDHHIDRWIQIAIESGVEVLELRLTGGPMRNWYNLPLCVAEAKSLTKLVLSGEIRLDPAFINHSLKFFSMRTLSLSHILFGDEGVMEHFISHCPLIEHLTLHFCNVYNPLSVGDPSGSGICKLNSLSLHGLRKLKGASVKGILEVYIAAPNLENLCYVAPADMDESFKLNLDSCTNLKCLSLSYLRSPDKWLLELLYKIPFLQSLMLHYCSLSERINIMSAQLKVLELSYCSNVKEVNVDAPNLLSLVYRGENQPVISFRRTSNELEVKVCSCSLRNCLQNIKPQNILASVSLFIYQSFPIEPMHGAFQVSSIPPTVRRLELACPPENEALYFPFMNYLFSSCCPKLITFKLSSNKVDRKAFIEIVKVTCSFKFDENADLKTMLDALPKCSYDEKIAFMLEL